MKSLLQTDKELLEIADRIYWNLMERAVRTKEESKNYKAIVARVDEIRYCLIRLEDNIEQFVDECPEVNETCLKEYDVII